MRASKFLEANHIGIAETVPASRKLQKADASALLHDASRLIVAKGRKVSEYSGDGVRSKEAVRALLGPTGNLRAPAVRTGTTLLVGFNEDVYIKVFLGSTGGGAAGSQS